MEIANLIDCRCDPASCSQRCLTRHPGYHRRVERWGAAPEGHSNFDDSGWEFTNASPVTITALGLFANGGLASAHQVSIYSLSGALQVSAVVHTGLSPDSQGYVYASLGTPFALPAGTWIVAASYAQNSPDLMRVGSSGTASSVVMSSPLTYGGAFIWFNVSTPVNPTIRRRATARSHLRPPQPTSAQISNSRSRPRPPVSPRRPVACWC
jgi:hypothetical protein